MPVHLTEEYEMNEIKYISKKYGIPIIEDAAQSIGSKYYGQMSGYLEKSVVFLPTLKKPKRMWRRRIFVTNNEILQKAKAAEIMD